MKTKLITAALAVIFLCGTAFTLNNDKYFEIAKNLEIFTSVYKELNTHYVDELDPNTLMRTGIDAIMNSLDPYTVYYSESQVESYRISLDNKYDGLGASSKDVDGHVTVVEVYKDGPSYEAGIKVGDQITSINGQTTKGRSYEDVMMFLRGFPGTSVQIGIMRPEENEKYNFEITRSEVAIPNVPYSGMINEDVGYIALTTFTRDAGKNIAGALRTLRKNNELKGLILDLRSNGGGLLSEAVDILGIFLPKESLVVTTKGKVRERDQTYNTRRTPIDTELPIVVLINKSSASASEIVSGAIQDYDRGVILGQRSYGKGLVQNQQEVGYNSRIKVTTSKYYIPSGRCIQSVAYENGEPKDIPDEDREVFKTMKGRPVLDGGGVTPDIKLDPFVQPEVLKALNEENWIFKYANQYVKQNPVGPGLTELTFDSYNDFLSFTKKGNFQFETDVEEALSDLVDKAKNNSALKSDVDAIKSKVLAEKSDDLTEHQADITKQIEIEIAKRYNYQEGKAYQRLKNDPEVDAAVKVLMSQDSYTKILQK